MKKNNCVNCAACGFSELCSAYFLEQQDQIFVRDFETKKKIARGDEIYQQGDKVDALFALRSGVAKIYNTQGLLTGVVLPGQVMGAEELHTGICQQNIQAATEIEVCVLRSQHYYEMSQLMTGFTDYIVRILSRSVREKQQFISVLTKSDALQKVQYFLQLLSDNYKEHGFEHRNIALPLSKKELAELLGISVSTLARALENLSEQGVIVLLNNKELTLLGAQTA